MTGKDLYFALGNIDEKFMIRAEKRHENTLCSFVRRLNSVTVTALSLAVMLAALLGIFKYRETSASRIEDETLMATPPAMTAADGDINELVRPYLEIIGEINAEYGCDITVSDNEKEEFYVKCKKYSPAEFKEIIIEKVMEMGN